MDPTILDLTGVEIEIRAWRGTSNPFLVTVEAPPGTVLNLTGYDVTMVVLDRSGGTVKFTATNVGPAGHSSPTAGQTRFVVPASAFSGLTGQRTYTWKYQVVVRDQVTGAKYLAFHGDFRVLAPHTAV